MSLGHSLIAQLNWNLLRTFHVIAEERSLTSAAKRLSVSQPSISAALQKLEQTLGCQLIERDSRHFALTDSGKILLNECATIYRCVDRIGEKLATVSGEISGVLNLHMVTSLQSVLIDEAIRLMHQRHPSVTFRIDIASSKDIVRDVSRKHVPFGLCLLVKPVEKLTCRMLFREEFGIYCGQEHPLFGSDVTSIEDLREEAFVVFTCAEEGGVLEPMVSLREGAGLGRVVAGSSPQLGEVRRMIVSGVGIGIMPTDSVEREVAAGLLWRLPIADAALGANVYLVTNPSRKPERIDDAFEDVISDILASSV